MEILLCFKVLQNDGSVTSSCRVTAFLFHFLALFTYFSFCRVFYFFQLFNMFSVYRFGLILSCFFLSLFSVSNFFAVFDFAAKELIHIVIVVVILTPKVISDTSFESGMSDDYAIPPDALSQSESTCMDASMPSLLMRTSYADSPNKKLESLEKVKSLQKIIRTVVKNWYVDHCVQIGHLAKLGGKLKTWRKRWFVLKNGSLTYWKSQNDVNRLVCACVVNIMLHTLLTALFCQQKTTRSNHVGRFVSHRSRRRSFHVRNRYRQEGLLFDGRLERHHG